MGGRRSPSPRPATCSSSAFDQAPLHVESLVLLVARAIRPRCAVARVVLDHQHPHTETLAPPRCAADENAVAYGTRPHPASEGELLRDSMANAGEIASRFPRLRASLDTAAADYGAAPENTFEFGLHAILDGLQAQLIASRTPADHNARRPPRHDQAPRATSPTTS
jgi:hypothetical protein